MIVSEKQAVEEVKILTRNKSEEYYTDPKVAYFPGWCLFDTTQILSKKAAIKLYVECLFEHRGAFFGYFARKFLDKLLSPWSIVIRILWYSTLSTLVAFLVWECVAIANGMGVVDSIIGFMNIMPFFFIATIIIFMFKAQIDLSKPAYYDKYDQKEDFRIVTIYLEGGEHYDYQMGSTHEVQNAIEEFVFRAALLTGEDMCLLKSACNRMSKLEKFLLIPNYPCEITMYELINKKLDVIDVRKRAKNMYLDLCKDDMHELDIDSNIDGGNINITDDKETLRELQSVLLSKTDENEEVLHNEEDDY